MTELAATASANSYQFPVHLSQACSTPYIAAVMHSAELQNLKIDEWRGENHYQVVYV
jgi:hypothetical protein